MPAPETSIEQAASLIRQADALLIGAGAGFGVDSGLPDFRGPEGFWNAYPPYRKLGLNFTDLANPRWFRDDPAFAWGFYGHRRNLYRSTTPHEGFAVLKRWVESKPEGGFVFTSNVDGQFQRAGFDADRIVEIHGSIDWNQCLLTCTEEPFPAGPEAVTIDETTMKAEPPLPHCPHCQSLARPNILMFGDRNWIGARTEAQHARFDHWLSSLNGRFVVVEMGAGAAIPTVRRLSEEAARVLGGSVVRINPRDPEVPRGPHVSLSMGARDALQAIDAAITG